MNKTANIVVDVWKKATQKFNLWDTIFVDHKVLSEKGTGSKHEKETCFDKLKSQRCGHVGTIVCEK